MIWLLIVFGLACVTLLVCFVLMAYYGTQHLKAVREIAGLRDD